MCIAFLIIAKYCDTCIQVFGQRPVDVAPESRGIYKNVFMKKGNFIILLIATHSNNI